MKEKQAGALHAYEGNSILFAYGSLLDAAHRAAVIGREVETERAAIRDYERGRRRHYYLRKRRGSETQGLLLLGLTAADFVVLDRYEEVPILYTREWTEVTAENGSQIRCWVYLPTARVLGSD